jgi:hypothetical protein
MSLRIDEATRPAVPAMAQELAELTTVVTRWGMEAGFLGIDGQLEGRLPALLSEASMRLFGPCEAEREQLLCQIEAAEKAREQAARRLDEVRARRESAGAGWFGRLRLWWTEWIGSHAESRTRRRQEPDLREKRVKFEIADLTRREACQWREMAMQSLRATFEYHQTRAALVRAER